MLPVNVFACSAFRGRRGSDAMLPVNVFACSSRRRSGGPGRRCSTISCLKHRSCNPVLPDSAADVCGSGESSVTPEEFDCTLAACGGGRTSTRRRSSREGNLDNFLHYGVPPLRLMH